MTAALDHPHGSESPAPKTPSAAEYAHGVWNRIAKTYYTQPDDWKPGGLMTVGAMAQSWARHGKMILAANPPEKIIRELEAAYEPDLTLIAKVKAATGTNSIVSGIMDRARAALGIGTDKAPAMATTASTARPVAIPAPVATAVDPLAGMSVQDRQEIAAWEKHYAALRTEAERDAYADCLAAQMKATAKPAAASKPAPSLDEQYAAITDPQAKVEFLHKHSREVLRRR